MSIKLKRSYLPENFSPTDWQSIVPFFQELVERPIQRVQDLQKWMQDRSELESVLSENLGWRYIRMTCDTTNTTYQKAYDEYITQIEPNIQPYTDKLDKKLLDCPFTQELISDGEKIIIRTAQAHQKTFREENIPLQTQIQQLQVKYGTLVGGLSVEVDGKECTLQQAATYLQLPDRQKREQVWKKIQQARYSLHVELDQLFSELLILRHKVATQAGFDNFRDFMFVDMCRFDYTSQECMAFHESVHTQVVPILENISKNRKKTMALDILRPWDLAVDTKSRPALKPFTDGHELCALTIKNFARLHPSFAKIIEDLVALGHVDVESRKGKAPGGYNYPLYETGYPFIFMNAAGTIRDVVTMVHEGGHALHSVFTATQPLINYKNFPSEIAELASMSMELFSMEHWDIFFSNTEELKRAKKDHLEQIIETLPWVATIDAFQHQIYTAPNHTSADRLDVWNRTYNRFSSKTVDWSDYETYKSYLWQKQLHLFEVPFYYIEYGIAQLGAIALWRNYKSNPEKTLLQYTDALTLGYTKSIPDIYAAAGIQFDFSPTNIKELMTFVQVELAKLDD